VEWELRGGWWGRCDRYNCYMRRGYKLDW